MAHAQAAVDRNHCPRDVPSPVAGQEGDDRGDLLRRRVPTERDLAHDLVAPASSGISAVMSVSTKPGATTLAVIPRDPSSRAVDRANPMSPALAAA